MVTLMHGRQNVSEIEDMDSSRYLVEHVSDLCEEQVFPNHKLYVALKPLAQSLIYRIRSVSYCDRSFVATFSRTFETTGKMANLVTRHIQNMSEAQTLEPHWGYADRALPCVVDKGSCEYLDVVYHSHDLGMLYSGIIWATIGGILFVWCIARRVLPSRRAPTSSSFTEKELYQSSTSSWTTRLQASISTTARKYLSPALPSSLSTLFGLQTTRLQLLTFLILLAYVTIWTFIGITYQTWVTPVKNKPGVYNTRTSLGPWSDRIGVLAYAFTPLSVLLSSRESLLSLLTGLPYQNFNFLHRWLGYVIFVQSALHTIGWSIIELRLYQPQPQVGISWIKQLYMIWGVIAMFLLTVLFVLSTPWAIRRTGYEVFRKMHYVLAMLYIGACWGHWEQLKCWLIPSLVVWFLDRCARLLRTWLLHYNYIAGGTSMAFKSAQAQMTLFPDDTNGNVVRLDFFHMQESWRVGQHFYLCFPGSSIWQSHPFTPLNLPGDAAQGKKHSYVFRAKNGETKKIAKIAERDQTKSLAVTPTTPVILTGPYGESVTEDLTESTNILCVAGGTGITYVLPVLLDIVNQTPQKNDRKVELVWAIRRKQDMKWIQHELDLLQKAATSHGITIRIFVTREDSKHHQNATVESDKITPSSSSSVSSNSDAPIAKDAENITIKRLSCTSPQPLLSEHHHHPDVSVIVKDFVDTTVRGHSVVIASGPTGMLVDVRRAVALCNSGSEVWKGNERADVRLICDDRLEWY